MLSTTHKSSSVNGSGSAANVQRKAAGKNGLGLLHRKAESKSDNTATLQRMIRSGNSVNRTSFLSSVQPKLSLGKPGDKFETEAESKADRVMKMAISPGESTLIHPAGNDISSMIALQSEEEEMQMQPVEEEEQLQAKNEEEEESIQLQVEEKKLQARSAGEEELQLKARSNRGRSNGEVTTSFESSLSGTKSSGEPLSGSVRNFMEPRFGADFSNVRIHKGPEAAELSSEINAQAFTHGRDIYFNDGKYDPDSSSGKHLIAHELTHTIQQGAAVKTRPSRKNTASTSSSQKIQRSWLGDAWNAVSGAAKGAAEWVGDSLEAGKDWLLDWLKDRVDEVPGYKLFTVVLGQDPVTKKGVPRNGRNFIEAGLDIIPNGETYKNKLQEQGNLTKAANWLDDQLKTLEGVNPATIAESFNNFWKSLGLSDVRSPDQVLKRLLSIFSRPINRIIQFAKSVAVKFLEIVKDFLLSKIVGFIKKKQSPTFYPLLTVVLGHDPITGEEVDRSGKNILTGFIKLHPDGDQQLKQMKETKSFDRAVKWIDSSIGRIQKIAKGLKGAFLEIWNAVTDINTLLDPTGTFERIYIKFKTPLVKLASFMWTVGKKILKFIKDALLSRLSAFARNTRGYPLITVMLGRDPFTKKKVPRTIENIIKGFFSLIPGGGEKFKKLKQSGAIAQMTSWMSGAVERLGITWKYIVGLFKAAWERLTIDALAAPVKAFVDILKLFTPPIRRIINFVAEVMKKVIEILLRIMNFPVNLISSIMEKTTSVFGLIKKDPIGFIKNLLRGLKQGFQQFFDNITSHLLGGLTDWLFGTLAEAGIKPPPDLSLKSILGLVLEILGITRDRIFDKIAEKIGREKMERIKGFVDKIKGVWAFVKDVMTRGPVAIWEYVKEKISNLWNVVFEQVKSWIMEKIIAKVTTKLLSMLDPSGLMAVVNSFIAIYNAIESFIAYFTKMLQMVNRFVDGVAAVARGNLAPAANKLENSLSKGIPIAIGFLANQVGLSGLGKKIEKMIEAVRAKVDGAIEWLINKAIKAGSAIVNMGKSAVGSIKSWWKTRKKVRTQDAKEHEVYFEGTGTAAQLTIASDPQSYLAYLDKLKSSYGLKEKNIAEAKSIAKKIEMEKVKNVSEEEQENHGAKINNLVDEMVEETAKIPLRSSGKTNGTPVYGPLRQGFGTMVRLSFLRSPHKMGSRPKVQNTPEFNSINLRRKGNGAFYVKGHLLNDNLGGPGNMWSNLTPITVKANSDHKNDFENEVKTAVNGSPERGLNPKEPKGHLRDFKVRAEYGRSLPSSYDVLVNEETDEVPSGMPVGADPFQIARILKAEQFVPRRLECFAKIQNEGEDEEKTLKVNIENDIQYGQLSNYSLDPTPKEDYVLAEQINFNAETKNEAVKDLTQLKSIGPVRAGLIYDSFKESGRIFNFKKQIGITKKTIEKNNPHLRIKGGTKS